MMVVLTTMNTHTSYKYFVGEGHPDTANFTEIPLDEWICKFQSEVGKDTLLFRIRMQNK